MKFNVNLKTQFSLPLQRLPAVFLRKNMRQEKKNLLCQLVKRKSTSHIKKMMTICPRDASKPDHENCSSSEPATFSHVIGKSFARKFFPADSADAPGRKNFFARKDGRQAHRRRQVSFFLSTDRNLSPSRTGRIQKSPRSHNRLWGLFSAL